MKSPTNKQIELGAKIIWSFEVDLICESEGYNRLHIRDWDQLLPYHQDEFKKKAILVYNVMLKE